MGTHHDRRWSGLLLGALAAGLLVPGSAQADESWTYTYTADGQVKTVDGPRTDVSDVTTYAYDASGNRIRVTNALGQVTAIPDHDGAGRPLRIVDPNGVETTLAYDARGRLTSRTVAGATTTYDYDAAGELTGIELPNGQSLNYEYDAAHRLTAIEDGAGNRIEYTLDAAGNRIEERRYDPSGTLTATHSRVYDALSRLIREVGAAGQTTRYGYDPNGNRTATTDANGHASSAAFDALDRLVSQTDAATAQTRIEHNAADEITAVTDARGNTTTYDYDGLGHRIAAHSGDSGTTTYAYDAAGNLIQRTDANGVVTEYSYDALNRLTTIHYPASSSGDRHFTYDEPDVANGIGRLTHVEGPYATTRYAYTARGQIAEITRTIAGVDYRLAYTYDDAGRVTSITYPSGRGVMYVYDAAGRVSRVIAMVDGNLQVVADAISYQPFGGVNSLTYGNGLTETRIYDLDGRLTDISLDGADGRHYSYDAVGNITAIDHGATTHTYGYDAVDRLTFAETGDALIDQYSYDLLGNRTAHTDNSDTEGLTYAADSNRLADRGGTAVTHDAAGNRTADGRYTYQYTPENRLWEVLDGGTLVAAYAYDFQGLRQYKLATGGFHVYLHGPGGRLLGEYELDGTLIRKYIPLNGRVLAQIDATEDGGERITYLHPDQLGSPRLGTDSAGTVVWRWPNASPFGANAPEEDPDGDGQLTTVNLRFPGQYNDQETGLHYNWHRYYDPETGRYLASDPIGLNGGRNVYNYAKENPLIFSDPGGFAYSPTGEHGISRIDGTPLPPNNGHTAVSATIGLNTFSYDTRNGVQYTMGLPELSTSIAFCSGPEESKCEARSKDRPVPRMPDSYSVVFRFLGVQYNKDGSVCLVFGAGIGLPFSPQWNVGPR